MSPDPTGEIITQDEVAPDTEISIREPTQDELELLQGAFDDNVDQQAEIAISRVAILQPASPEVAQGKPGYKAGQLVDSINRSILTQRAKPLWLIDQGVNPDELTLVDNMMFVPIAKLPFEYVKWKTLEERTEEEPIPFHWKSLDKTEEKVREGIWKKHGGTYGTLPDQDGRPPVTVNTNYLVLPIDQETMTAMSNFVVLTFSRTSSKAGEKLATFMAGHRFESLAPYGRTYFVSTNQKVRVDAGQEQTYYVMDINKGGKTSIACPAMIPMVHQIALQLASKETGKDAQLAMINATDLSDDTSNKSGESNEAPTDNADPFAAPEENDDDF
jgi:hypothetical protein